MSVQLANEFKHMQWLGRGPHECYPDRKRSAMMGVYKSTVDEQFVPYIYPSENAGKSDCQVID